MISLLLLLLLAWNFYIGSHRGIILQTFYFFSSLISIGAAAIYYKRLSEVLTLWVPFSNATPETSVNFFKSVDLFDLDKIFYSGLSFFVIYLAIYTVFRVLGIFVHFVKSDRFHKPFYTYLSGGLAVLVTMLSLSLFFNVLAAVPLQNIQSFLAKSFMIRFLIDFPLFSWLIHYFWLS
ncbi:CvpA family protein [Streptococcus macacae]|uniref:Colicin V production protein n=1 Tax=Streptococcus macacae NCTC 11558 TaxID=764298 RepID=G5JXH4_9STRE|nr:CvpA family protein [Streptococcus macacae]EHJ52069.1 colicin V production protein [Streptococcus macacae NCTC 11558]SUN79247.1 CvpA family protein [Streptococcus macacae NCTC 11558]